MSDNHNNNKILQQVNFVRYYIKTKDLDSYLMERRSKNVFILLHWLHILFPLHSVKYLPIVHIIPDNRTYEALEWISRAHM